MDFLEKTRQAVDRAQYEACWTEIDAPPFDEFVKVLGDRLGQVAPDPFDHLSIRLSSGAPNRIRVDGSLSDGKCRWKVYGEIVWVAKPRFFRGTLRGKEIPPPVPPASIPDFIRTLDAITASDGVDLVARIEDAAKGVDGSSVEFEAAIPSIFALFEKHPEREVGSPGILVHLLESRAGAYEDELLRSLSRQPSMVTLDMVNRILNSSLSPENRQRWLQALEEVARNRQPTDLFRREAEEYLDYQRGSSGDPCPAHK